MRYLSIYTTKVSFKPAILLSVLALSIVAMSVPLAANSPFVATNFTKISHTLVNLIENQGNVPVNVLITTTTKDYTNIVTDIQRLGGQVRTQFQYIEALAASIQSDKILTLVENENIVKIYFDETRSLAGAISRVPELDPKPETASAFLEGYETVTLTPETIGSVEPNNYWNPVAMGAEPVWAATGDRGQDSLVVIIDTGLWAGHGLFGGTSIIGGVDLSPDVGGPYEGWSSPENHWHGTHVAGIVASTGGIIVPEDDLLVKSIEYHTGMTLPSGDPGYKVIWLLGMAPAADLYAIKVFSHTGAGVSESYILAAMEYALDLKLVGGYDVDVISMSLGGPNLFDGRDVEDQLVDYITSHGITIVAAAGNDGPAQMTVGSPGSANTAITVGAAATQVQTRVFWDVAEYGILGIGDSLFTSETPQIYAFSSRGPTSDGRLKPTLSATGIFVMSAVPPQGIAWASGTSMACPAVSGAVALLNTYAEAFIPGATPEDYKQALQNGAVWLEGYNEYDQGAGFLNAYNALVELVNDPSIGDVAKPLRKYGWLKNIMNIPIVGFGTYETEIIDLPPGHKKDFVFKATYWTGSIELEITNVELGDDPLGMNSFEVYIQSAKRTMYDYFIDSANVWEDASFLITEEFAPIEPGYVKIVIENDWTSYDAISADIKITVKPNKPPKVGFFEKGQIAEGEWTDWIHIEVPDGTERAIIQLKWSWNWARYPTNDLDLFVQWFDGTDWLMSDGATLNSPEQVILENPVDIYVSINAYAQYTFKEIYYIYVFFE